MNLYCQSCGFPVTQHEAIYYSGRCSCCVEDDMQQLVAYEQGQPNARLDYFFGVNANDKVKH